MIDISREENLRIYLENSDMLDGDRPLSIHYFSGGVSGAGQLKVGSAARSERTAKWNEAIRIERSLGASARYPSGSLFAKTEN